MSIYEGIVEVAETGKRQANDLLALGYRLLAVEQVARPQERTGDSATPGLYVVKFLVYVVGRTSQQTPIVEVLEEWRRRGEEARAPKTPVETT